MAVQAVHLEADAFLVCLNHALSTEKEEVMGLCIGEVDTSRIVHIHSVIILRRSDKRKDRVEISPEQLSAASTEAERLAEMTGRPMRVVGWYHSHPHITVWPSHVDVRTQAMYQMMDQGFVGLIFSCFIEDKNTKLWHDLIPRLVLHSLAISELCCCLRLSKMPNRCSSKQRQGGFSTPVSNQFRPRRAQSTRELKFLFMWSPMKPLGKCAWNQLWSCPRSCARRSKMHTGEFTASPIWTL
ncbi:lys-63-specific deubiquitinase BRCC36 isoform X2 [Alligator sinensis]|uniref:Lys-63-specific deubiquitinase BRCC36 isoform X2 n=1 Tax=Alligator sinensis TaxID=38654 RepID=A0A3Q0GPM5_ALLSI|nr:lys-63-specific deubiquitinase BRCC36 isoform X2 [Alligator sinensis]